MGKHEGNTPKAIANRIKAKGLQKLKFYCQVCEKQCRDANGFKCHIASESHVRKMQLFSANAGKYLADYSAQFEKGFLDILSRRHNTKRINANFVYNEYIQNKEHIHMNATRWTSLSQFVQYLGETAKCFVEEDERGWYIQWIDRNPEKMKRQAALSKKRKHDMDDEDLRRKEMIRQIEAAGKPVMETIAPSHISSKDELNVSISIGKKPSKKSKTATNVFQDGDDEEDEKAEEKKQESKEQSRKPAAHSTSSSSSSSRSTKKIEFLKNCWLVPGLVVKVTTGKAGKQYKNKKGVVRSVETIDSKVFGMIKMLKAGVEILVKETGLETVLPDLGHTVMIVSPKSSFKYRGQLATLLDVNLEKFSAKIKLAGGIVVEQIDYENICKVQRASPPS